MTHQRWSTGAVRVGAGNRFEFQPPATEPWMGDALCAQVDLEVFFPQKGGSTLEAKTTCRMCWVQEECLAYALANDEQDGIWGGLSTRERRKVKAKQALAADVEPAPRPTLERSA